MSLSKESYWSRFASEFDEDNFYVLGKQFIEEIRIELSKIKNLGRVLEFGCGSGLYTESYAENSDDVFATDYSAEMVEFCSEKFKNIEKISVEQANCYKTSYESDSFDTIIMINLIHVISNPKAALKESYRLLKPSGKIFLIDTTSVGMNIFEKIKLGIRILKTYGKPPKTFKSFSMKKMEDLVQNTNFKICNSRRIGSKIKANYILAEKAEIEKI